jgi:hypothetical protein
MYGKHHSEATRQKLSADKLGKTYEQIYGEISGKAKREITRTNTTGRGNPMFGKVPPGSPFCKALKGHWVKSTWERTVCDWLYTHDIEYQYEPQTFDFGEFTYTPDIYIPQWDAWWEVKGWWDKLSQKKCQAFADNHPDNFQIIDKENINLFRGD